MMDPIEARACVLAEYERRAVAVPCPTCQAAAGAECPNRTHIERVEAFIAPTPTP